MNLEALQVKKTVALIARGLMQKERCFDGQTYPYDGTLHHGINTFFALCLQHSGLAPEAVLLNANETAFLRIVATRPVAQWFETWDSQWLEQTGILRENYCQEEEPLIYFMGKEKNVFFTTETCADLLSAQARDLVNDIDQTAFYQQIKGLTQSQYALIRRYVIEHPLVTEADFRGIKLQMNQSTAALEAIGFAYEPVVQAGYVCPHCGWTMTKTSLGYSCCSRRCTAVTPNADELQSISPRDGYLRLRLGIMRYTALPGQLELEIEAYAKSQGLEAQLWPYQDTYDVQITFADGGVWQIDAKAYASPYLLRERIQNDDGFPKTGAYECGFYVVPDWAKRERSDYCKIVQSTIDRCSPGVECVTLRMLKQRIGKRKVGVQ